MCVKWEYQWVLNSQGFVLVKQKKNQKYQKYGNSLMDSMIALVNIILTFINPFKFYYSGHYDIHLAF